MITQETPRVIYTCAPYVHCQLQQEVDAKIAPFADLQARASYSLFIKILFLAVLLLFLFVKIHAAPNTLRTILCTLPSGLHDNSDLCLVCRFETCIILLYCYTGVAFPLLGAVDKT